jgi:hypothetical protein
MLRGPELTNNFIVSGETMKGNLKIRKSEDIFSEVNYSHNYTQKLFRES